jgi:hypothetical protein
MQNRWVRSVAFTVVTATVLILAAAASASAQHPSPQPPQPRQSPNAPTNQNVPQGLDGPQLTPDSDKVSVDAQNDREIRAGVDRLYTLVLELKNEVNQTNTNMVLNTSVVKRAQDIEKLAKQIKDRAKR